MMVLLSVLTLIVLTLMSQLRLVQKNLHYEQENFTYYQRIHLAKQEVIDLINNHHISNICQVDLTIDPSIIGDAACPIPGFVDIHYRVEKWPYKLGNIFIFYLEESHHRTPVESGYLIAEQIPLTY